MFKQATKSHQHKKTIKLSVATASVEQISPAVCVCATVSYSYSEGLKVFLK